MSQRISFSRNGGLGWFVRILLIPFAALPGCTWLSQDIHLHSDSNQTLITTADNALRTFSTSDAGIMPTAQNNISDLMALQQIVDTNTVDFAKSVSSYDAVNQTWDGLRADFLIQVGLLDADKRKWDTTQQGGVPGLIQTASDEVDARIAQRLVVMTTVANLLEQLVTVESKLADQATANLKKAADTVNATQAAQGSVPTTQPTTGSGTDDLSISDIQAFMEFEQYVLKAAKSVVAARGVQQALPTTQTSAANLTAQLLKTIETSRDSDAVAALAPIIGTGLDDASFQMLNQFVLELNGLINGQDTNPSPPTDTKVDKSVDYASSTNSADKILSEIVVNKTSRPFRYPRKEDEEGAKEAEPQTWSDRHWDLQKHIALAAATIQLRQIEAATARSEKAGGDPINGQRDPKTAESALKRLNLVVAQRGLPHIVAHRRARKTLGERAVPGQNNQALTDPGAATSTSQLVLTSIEQLKQTAAKLSALANKASARRHELDDLKLTLENQRTIQRRSSRKKELSSNGDIAKPELLRSRAAQGGRVKHPADASKELSSNGDIAQPELLRSRAAQGGRDKHPADASSDGVKISIVAAAARTLIENPASAQHCNPQALVHARGLQAADNAAATLRALNTYLETHSLAHVSLRANLTAKPADAPDPKLPEQDAKELESVVKGLKPIVTQLSSVGSAQANGLAGQLNAVIAELSSLTKDSPLSSFVEKVSSAFSQSQTLLSAIEDFATQSNNSLASVLQSGGLDNLLSKTLLSSNWLQNVVAAVDPKAAATVAKTSYDGTLLNEELTGPLADLGDKLLSILFTTDEKARTDLVQDYLNQIYQQEVNLYQEQQRHYKALDQIAQLEIQRWTILQEINQNVSVTFKNLENPNVKANAGDHYFPFEGPRQEDFANASTRPSDSSNAAPAVAKPIETSPATTTASTGPTTSTTMTTSAASSGASSTLPAPLVTTAPPPPDRIRDAQVDRLALDVSRELATFDPVDHDAVKGQSQIFASLRALAFKAKPQFTGDKVDPTDIGTQSKALAANQRLKDLIKLLNSSLLMESVNLKLSLDNGRQLRQELMWHDLQLDQLESAVQEANMQYRLDDLKIYHSGGITKQDVEAIANDIGQAVELGIIAGKTK